MMNRVMAALKNIQKQIQFGKQSALIAFKVVQLVWRYEKLLLVGSFIAVVIPGFFPIVQAYFLKLVIDQVVKSLAGGGFDANIFTITIVGALVINFLGRMFGWTQRYMTRLIQIKFPIHLYQLVLNKITTLDVQYFENSEFKDTLQKVRDTYATRPLDMLNVTFFVVQSLLQIVISLGVIIHLNPFLVVLMLIVAIPDLINQIYFSNMTFGIWNLKTPQRKRFSYLSNLLQGRDSVKETKIFQTSTRFLNEIKETQMEFYRNTKTVLDRQYGVNTIFNLLDTVVFIGIYLYMVLEALARRITVGDISFYQTAASGVSGGIVSLFERTAMIFDHSQYVQSVFDLLDAKPLVEEKKDSVKVDFNQTPKIEFKNVSFTYPGTKKKILKNFSLIINAGEKVAFVGENGAGKSTMIKLLARFYDVDDGEILINDINIKDLELESWYKSLGVLFQDFIQYEYPVKDNIFFGRIWEQENLDQIIDAAKAAGAHPMISQFEKEYNQMLGRTFEGGLELSGGQWQKVALARAFFRNAPVLVLDEPTAAIDAKAESEIFGRVEKLSKSKTVIIISHRFSTVRNADKIYVIENGRISESGDHSELMKLDGQYATLFNLQAKGYQ